MIELQTKFILQTLVMVLLFAVSSQFSVAKDFVSVDQINITEELSTANNQNTHESKHQQTNTGKHCPDNGSTLHCGGCTLCAAVFTLAPELVTANSIYQSHYIDHFLYIVIDKEIRPPRV